MSIGTWSAMVVVGKKVTKEQACEIIIRTSGLRFSSNNHTFSQSVYEHVFKKKLNKQKYHCTPGDFFGDIEEYHSAIRRYGILDLEYLTNHRVVSSFIAGPHGWCNWGGTIFANSYNIGKWPSKQSVKEEWKLIAEAFPYLDLKCQLWSKEVGEDNNTPEFQFNVNRGCVTESPIEDLYVYPGDSDLSEPALVAMLLSANRYQFECGCSLEEAFAALDYVEDLIKNKKE